MLPTSEWCFIAPISRFSRQRSLSAKMSESIRARSSRPRSTRVFFNPPWNIPSDIAANEILPKVGHDPNYLAQNNMVMLPNGEVEQLPGPDSGLGQIMFDMPNRFDVYLHDTPEKNIFGRDDRRISHGCIRVEEPRELAALLMQQPIDAIDQGDRDGQHHPKQSASARAGIRGLRDRVRGCRGHVAISPGFLRTRRRDLATAAETPSRARSRGAGG